MPPRPAIASTQTAPSHRAVTRRQRVIVEGVQPEIEGGRFPIKRTPGESVVVTADVFADGHDLLAGVVKYRPVAAGQSVSVDAERTLSGPPRNAAAPRPSGTTWLEV